MRGRRRISIALASALFLVLAGTGVSSAYWSTHATIASTVKAGSLAADCQKPTSMTNGGFESPVIADGALRTFPADQVPGWDTTDAVGIELWAGWGGVASMAGRQFAELNASEAGTLSQHITTTPGQRLQWSLLHRGRSGTDAMQVLIGPAGGTQVGQRMISDGTTWGRHTGTYVVPAGQTTTQLSLRAVSTATGDISIGNLLDDISFGTGPCLVASSTISNITAPGVAARVGDTVEYRTTLRNSGGAPAMLADLRAAVPTGIELESGSLRVVSGDGSGAKSDAAGDDSAEYVTANRTVVARVGMGATASAGGAIPPEESTTFAFRAVVSAAAGSGTVSYAPAVGYTDALTGWGAAAVSPSISTAVGAAADVRVTRTSAPTAPVAGGATAPEWRFDVTNLGLQTSSSVIVTVDLPSSLTSRSVRLAGTSCSISNNRATCAGVSIGNQVTRSLVVTGTLPAAVPGGTSLVVTTSANVSTYDPSTANNSVTATATVTAEQTPPSTPGTPTVTSRTNSEIGLSWSASSDNVGVVRYRIYRNGNLAGTSTSSSFTDTGRAAGRTFVYTVEAMDAADNVSARSGERSATTTSTAPVAGTDYRVRSAANNLCVDADFASTNSGTRLIQYTCSSATNQKWRFVATSDGYFRVLPEYSDSLVWSIEPGTRDRNGNYTDGRYTQVRTWAGDSSQQWLPVPEGGGNYHFVNRDSGKCLDVPSGSAELNLQLQQWTCSSGPSDPQTFSMTAL